jgi:replicative DNA helicase
MSEKTVPAVIEIEEAIIGCLLFDPNAIHELDGSVDLQAFFSVTHRTIFEVALQLNKKNQTVDFISVSQRLDDLGLLDKVGGNKTLTRLLNKTISASNLDRYISLLNDKYFRRKIINCGLELTEIGYDLLSDSENTQKMAEEKFFDLLNREQTNPEPEHISISMVKLLDGLDDESPVAIETKILDLDNKITGLMPKNLYIIAARPSVGKTWVGLNITKSVADQGKRVLFLSAESSKEELNTRFVAMDSTVSSDKIIRKKLSGEELERVTHSAAKLIESEIYFDDRPATDITINMVRSSLRKLAIKGKKPDLLVVDYLQKLGKRSAVNRAQIVGEITGGFKDIAKEFDIPVVCLAQVNRELNNRADKRPLMSDLKDSGDIEQDADVIMTLYRDEYHNSDSAEQGILEINIAKNRNGEIGVCRCLFNPATGEIKNLKEFIQGVA